MMPLHRRHVAETTHDDSSSAANRDATSSKTKTESPSLASSEKQRRSMSILGLFTVQLLLLVYAATKTKINSISHLMVVLLTAWVISLPIIMILGIGLGTFGSASDLPHQRYIPLAVVATIIGNQLPTFLSSGMAAVGILVFGLSSRPIPQPKEMEDSNSPKRSIFFGPLGAVLATILMIAVLLTENFFIWVVSATYKPSQNMKDLPQPLQDNGQLILRYFFDHVVELTKREIVTLRNMINVEWILVSGLGVSLVAIELQGKAMRRNLWSLALRGVLTMTFARTIRTVSFLITVLPSQNPRCYFNHFPVPPPADWLSWLMVGFIPQANGGCNDLIISGHATVTSTLACFVTSIVGKPLFSTALWIFVAIDYMVEVYEGFHYSVDMWLGALLVNFIWTVLAPLEEPDKEQRGGAAKQFLLLDKATQSDWVIYAIPVVGVYVQVNGFIPPGLANYTILVYLLAVIFQISQYGFRQYTQHCLFCMLYMALGVYL